jgi:hypothetical protein
VLKAALAYKTGAAFLCDGGSARRRVAEVLRIWTLDRKAMFARPESGTIMVVTLTALSRERNGIKQSL